MSGKPYFVRRITQFDLIRTSLRRRRRYRLILGMPNYGTNYILGSHILKIEEKINLPSSTDKEQGIIGRYPTQS